MSAAKIFSSQIIQLCENFRSSVNKHIGIFLEKSIVGLTYWLNGSGKQYKSADGSIEKPIDFRQHDFLYQLPYFQNGKWLDVVDTK